MMSFDEVLRIALLGAGATIVMDAWMLLLKMQGVPVLNFALVGRWVGHMQHGRFRHVAGIGQAAPVRGERAMGWLVHYAVGMAFALLLVAVTGLAWLQAPTLLPAIMVGMATVVMPLFIMQPAMGAGIASSRTPTPLRNCLRSLMTHTVFGLGLYLAALLLSLVPGSVGAAGLYFPLPFFLP